MATLTSLSLKPWGVNTTDDTALKDVLSRVNLERGHFRNITEASLQAEVAGDGALELSESDDDEEDEEKENEERAKGKPTTRQELFNAKLDMLQHVGAAEQDILMTLDFISLLLSKDAPGPASATISPALRQQVPVGTLGTDIWERMPQDRARVAQDELLANNVRMEGLQQSADSLLAAANRLQDNVRKETQYWDEILSISEKGWNVCRIPVQQRRLGVTFGFSESSPEFLRRGIAALNVGQDGSVSLDRGFGSKPKALRVLMKQNGNNVGSSKVAYVLDDGEKTLEARIRHARNGLFDEELYHEMVRESRSQASLGISMKGNAISFIPSQAKTANQAEVLFELIPADQDDTWPVEPQAQDGAAQAIAMAARLLLTQAHRERLRKRSEVPPPLSEKGDDMPILPILRPLMSFLLHQCAQAAVNTHLDRIVHLLSAAGVVHTCERAGFSLANPAALTTVESLVRGFMQTWVSQARLIVSDRDKTAFGIKMNMETSLEYGIGTTFMLTAAGRRTVRFSSLDEFRAATCTMIASGLAKALTNFAGEGWRCNEREALIAEENEAAIKNSNLWVTIDDDAALLALSSESNKASWSVNGESEQKSLWDAFSGMSRLQ